VKSLAQFKCEADVIVTNRMTDVLADVTGTVYNRDLIGSD